MKRLLPFLLLLCTTTTKAQFPIEDADLYVSPKEPWLVQHTAELLSQDITALTGTTPTILHALPAKTQHIIIIGTRSPIRPSKTNGKPSLSASSTNTSRE